MLIQEIQVLRVSVMILIVASHGSIIGGPKFDAGGDFGVAFFFVLSGLVTWFSQHQAIEDGSFRLKPYLKKRICKILWLHIATWILANLLDHNVSALLASLPALFLVQSWVPQSDIYFGGNPVSWFLSDLMLAWGLLPWLFKLVKKSWTMPCLLCLYVGWMIFLPEREINAWLYVWPPVRLLDFLLGMKLGQWITAHTILEERNGKLGSFNLILAVISIIGITAGLVWYEEMNAHLRNAAYFWPFILMLLYASCRGVKFMTVGYQTVWSKIAPWTMHIYLTHVLILRVITHYL